MALDLGIFLEGAQSTFKVKVSENDQQAQYLLDKLFSSDGSVTITETNDGGLETIDLTSSSSSPLTTKGDLFTYSTTDARLGVGSDGQALLADSAEATGLKWGTPSVDNMATADLTLTADRFHELDSNDLNLLGDETGVFKVKNSTLHSINPTTANGISFYQKSSALNYIKFAGAGMYIGSSTFDNLYLFTSGKSKFQNDLQVGGTGFIGGAGARLKVRGSNSLAGTYTVLFENSGGSEALRVENDRQTYTKRLNIKGLGSTSATTALLVENSSSTEALKVLDDLAIIMANLPTSSAGLATGQLWNNLGIVNIA